MKKGLWLVLIPFVLLLVFYRTGAIATLRLYLENSLVIPAYELKNRVEKGTSSLKVMSLEEKVEELEAENQTLRRQLGAIPERSNLLPAKVIDETDSQLILSFPYPADRHLVGHPVVLGEVYLGRIVRVGRNLMVADKPAASNFAATGETEARVKGKIMGQFNEQVVFETGVNNPLKKGDSVYLLDREHAWRFLLGKVGEINRNQRLPVKQAVINYLPSQATLVTVFVVE